MLQDVLRKNGGARREVVGVLQGIYQVSERWAEEP